MKNGDFDIKFRETDEAKASRRYGVCRRDKEPDAGGARESGERK